jgi:hypothetical protein
MKINMIIITVSSVVLGTFLPFQRKIRIFPNRFSIYHVLSQDIGDGKSENNVFMSSLLPAMNRRFIVEIVL